MEMRVCMNFGVIGYGYWGPNVVRNLRSIEGVKVLAGADLKESSRARARAHHPDLNITANTDEVLRSPEIDAIAVVSQVWTHFELAKAALENGKHVFVEKPLTANSAQARELVELAEKKNLRIMVDHTFLYTGAVRKIRQLLDEGALGKLYYYDSTRVNLGLFQHDVNVLWDLASHDLAIMNYLIGQTPEAISACGQAHLGTLEDMAYMTLYFPDKLIGHINVNWLSPVKVRSTLIGGEKKMLLWNDVAADEKLKIYDKGVDIVTQEDVYNLLVRYRSGDISAPQLDQREALNLELATFVECIREGRNPINDGRFGLRVVQMLEAADKSLKQRGTLVYL